MGRSPRLPESDRRCGEPLNAKRTDHRHPRPRHVRSLAVSGISVVRFLGQHRPRNDPTYKQVNPWTAHPAHVHISDSDDSTFIERQGLVIRGWQVRTGVPEARLPHVGRCSSFARGRKFLRCCMLHVATRSSTPTASRHAETVRLISLCPNTYSRAASASILVSSRRLTRCLTIFLKSHGCSATRPGASPSHHGRYGSTFDTTIAAPLIPPSSPFTSDLQSSHSPCLSGHNITSIRPTFRRYWESESVHSTCR